MIIVHGGSFNPITNGHEELEKKVSKILDCIVWITPCYKNLFKKDLAAVEHRIKMCEIICAKNNQIELSLFEIENKLSGSTLSLIKKMYESPFLKKEIYFLIGMDNANIIYTWKNYKELLNIGRFVVVPRIGFKENPKIDWYKKSPHIYLPNCNVQESYATFVREAFQNGDLEKAKRYIDPDIYKYIIDNHIY